MLTLGKLQSYLMRTLKNETEWFKKDCLRILEQLRGYELADEESRMWYDIHTWNDETAELFNRYGCTVTVSYDNIGQPCWGIYMPTSEQEWRENKKIWKETWT